MSLASWLAICAGQVRASAGRPRGRARPRRLQRDQLRLGSRSRPLASLAGTKVAGVSSAGAVVLLPLCAHREPALRSTRVHVTATQHSGIRVPDPADPSLKEPARRARSCNLSSQRASRWSSGAGPQLPSSGPRDDSENMNNSRKFEQCLLAGKCIRHPGAGPGPQLSGCHSPIPMHRWDSEGLAADLRGDGGDPIRRAEKTRPSRRS